MEEKEGKEGRKMEGRARGRGEESAGRAGKGEGGSDE